MSIPPIALQSPPDALAVLPRQRAGRSDRKSIAGRTRAAVARRFATTTSDGGASGF
jgi:hypothetical protein